MGYKNTEFPHNEVFFDKLFSENATLVKEANESVNEFTRMRMRETGILRRVLPPIPLSDGEIDRSIHTDKPIKIVDREPDNPPAYSVPLGTNPAGQYIQGDRYAVMFNRIMTRKYSKDVEELRTYHMDIRQVITDNSLKDMLTQEDEKFIGAVNNILGGVVDGVSPVTGTVMWEALSGGITRKNFKNALKIMPRTSNKLETATMLLNNITVKDFLGWGRDEVGGDLAEKMLIDGFVETQLHGVKIIVTIKHHLVPTDEGFMFAEPKFLGKFYMIEDATLWMDKRAFMLEFFAYEFLGAAIGNSAAVARVNWGEEGD